MRPSLFSSAVFCLLLTASVPSRADSPDPARKEAADRFDRGIHMVDSGDLSGALAEFQRAYALVPAPVVIYNVGLVYAAMNRPADAARALEKALKTPEALKPDIATRAAQVLREQSEKIGQVTLKTNVKEGSIEVDNIEVSKLPLPGPLDVAAGQHVIGVISRGYAPGRKEVLVPAKAAADVEIDVVPIEGLLGHIEVSSHVPAVDVFVDDGRVGKTPLESSITVAPGAHTIELRRAGYNPATRSVNLQDGAQAALSLDPTVDKTALSRQGGYLSLKTSEDQAIVSADGEELGLVGGAIQLPAGPHRIHVERGGFIPVERDVDVPVGGTQSVDIVFEPTPDTRAAYVSGALGRRTLSIVTMVAGAVIGAGGAIFNLAYEDNHLKNDQATLDNVNASFVKGAMPTPNFCDMSQNDELPNGMSRMTVCANQLDNAQTNVNNDKTLQTAGWVATGVGGAILVTGVVLLVTGDNPHKYDEKPPEEILGGWRVTPMFGSGGVSLSAGRAF
jgi:hypothetical protein